MCFPNFHRLSMIFSAGCVALLTACGGGGGSGSADTPVAAATTAMVAAATSVASPADLSSTQIQESNRAQSPISLTVRAFGSLAANVGPIMEVRLNGELIGIVEVRSTEPQDYVFQVPKLAPGAKIEVVFTNDAAAGAEDRNLFVRYVSDGTTFIAANQPGVQYDGGEGEAAFDGIYVIPGQESMWYSGALRFNWQPPATATPREFEASRFLQQATFGPTRAEVARLQSMSIAAWLDEQLAMPAQPSVLNYIQGKFDQSTDFRPPFGSKYTPDLVDQKVWANASTAMDQLRKRTAHALHSIFVISLVDSNLYHQARAYASYLDMLDRLAFGNFRAMIDEIALSPAMGLYLSHMRNMKEDAATHRLPDENFARELMQLFTIGLHELNNDGSPKLNAQGLPIETYSNADVMALAKVFTGYSWGLDDGQLTEANFHWGMPDYATTGANRADVRRMKLYPGMGSSTEKRLFTGTANAVVIPAGTPQADGVRMALDTLFNHSNVGPFLSRQLIQRLVTSNPSPAYVSRVAQVFNNNGHGVRGELGAVVRAILVDNEARASGSGHFGKLREPVLRVAHWMRSFGARSSSGEYQMSPDLPALGQRMNYQASVFGYFRPGYVPSNTGLAAAGLAAPEFQILDESTSSQWINTVELMLREGIGWNGTQRDVTLPLADETAMVAVAPVTLVNHLDLMLFSGRMTRALRKNILDAMLGVPEKAAGRDQARARVALYIAMTSPEYLVQR